MRNRITFCVCIIQWAPHFKFLLKDDVKVEAYQRLQEFNLLTFFNLRPNWSEQGRWWWWWSSSAGLCIPVALLDDLAFLQKRKDEWDILYMSRYVINLLTPNDDYSGRTAPLTSKCCILYIYSTNIGTEYFKHGIYCLFFPLQNAVCFINLTYLVPLLFTFYIQSVLKG